MQPAPLDPVAARQFATEIVQTLRSAGHESYWAGGCVRDEILGKVPVDYDVATAALPEKVRDLFGRRRTLAIGVAFGVITVLGPREAGQVEVTTFRSDAGYTDGRHPGAVTFTNAREDALRRDFTMNGMFLDPETGEVLDFVGGREDLQAGLVRCIGLPLLRFTEDHLRMLRAVRFAAGFGFILDEQTRDAIQSMAHLVVNVSPERLAGELRMMWSRSGRGRSISLLIETGLLAFVIPEWEVSDRLGMDWKKSAEIADGLVQPDLSAVLASVTFQLSLLNLREKDLTVDQNAVENVIQQGQSIIRSICSRLKLSNREKACSHWLLNGLIVFQEHGTNAAWSSVQPWLSHSDAPKLVDALESLAHNEKAFDGAFEWGPIAAWARKQIERPRSEIDPEPLVTGNDLLAAGISAGPALGMALARIRAAQLDGVVSTAAAALEWLRRL